VNLVPVDHNNDFARHGVRAMSARLIRHVVDPCPASLAVPTDAQRLAVRYTPYNGPGSENAASPSVSGARPHVVVVWGNSLNGLIGPRSFLVPTILEALADLPVDVSLACAPEAAAGLRAVPDNVRVLGYYPLHLLLPGSAAVIHHGGAGCAMTAVSAGVPQLALPFTPEQTTHANRVAATGAGLVFDGPTTPAAGIRAAVVRLLDDSSFRARAAELREEALGLPTPAELVERLAELAGERVLQLV
jgi:UDP:flavonoid glycosyltransferase YjiC (YdhE family)